MKYLNDAGGRFKLPLKSDAGKTLCTLLWGDPLQEIERDGERVKVRARKRTGWVPASAVCDTGLLEIYVIDVGQGDGVLMRTPHDDAWHMIDAGIRAAEQMTRKGAANFVRWKFIDDLKLDRVTLKNMIVTHPDADHYGGMIDLLSGALTDGRGFAIDIDRFWHCGIGRFKDGDKLGALRADTSSTPLAHADYKLKPEGKFIVELLDGKTHFGRPKRPFASGFADLAKLVGKVPKKVSSLSQTDGWLPGYAPAAGAAAIRVLGPIAEKLAGGGQGLRWLGSESVTRNGHSVVLRVDYGRARVLLTGDLNTASQRLLLSCQPAEEFNADVSKGCHHGSDDIDLRFVRAMAARATVISSGDNEDYAHPRPRILGASARYGRDSRDMDGGLMPPLLYSTELARSVGLDFASHTCTVAEPRVDFKPEQLEADFDDSPTGRYRRLSWLPMATDLVYGLVNVRSDGRRILCATMKEGSSDFDLQVFEAGVDAA
ncbi:MAG: MBL fold metallo-hydrolase [Burkholderiaceae bacterium]|nr:MBL fold metallo-hydrolase [Burkholderiaceae bacterium]